MSICTTSYSFKQEAIVYIYDNPTLYQIDISEINFSQTFTEHSYSNKSLQDPNMFEQSVINKANPANFEITIPAIREADLEILFDKAIEAPLATFDLYVQTAGEIFKIETCVVTNANFIVEKQRPLSLGISGEATKLTRADNLPTTPQARSGTRTYNRISDMSITLGVDTVLSDYLASFTLELQNDIKWTPYTSINSAVSGTTMYPTAFTLGKRILSGTITQYLSDTNNTNLQTWDTDTTLYIEAGQKVISTLYGFIFDIGNCSFTNRLQTGNVFTQSYDWRLTENDNALSTIVTYETT